ncbi:MAG: PAS domain S-box protein [Balneolales bacterium]|nr:PAS domain S-box protein [Balneolales bacterium]
MTNYRNQFYSAIAENPELIEFLTEVALDGAWMWDLENPDKEWMSPRFWELLGYSRTALPESAGEWKEHINEDDLYRARESLQKHINDPGFPFDELVRFRHQTGSVVWVRCTGIAIRDASGKVVRMLGIHRNETEIKRREEVLLRCNGEGNIGYWELETGSKMVHLSAVAAQILEVNGESLSPEIFTTALKGPNTEVGLSKNLEDIATKEGVLKEEIHAITIKGTQKWIRFVAMAEVYKNKTVRLYGTLQDIDSEMRKKEEMDLQKQRFQGVFNTTFSFIGLLDTNGIVLEINETALDFAGVKIADVAGKNFWETVWWQHSEEQQQQLKEDIRKAALGKSCTYEVGITAGDGKRLNIIFGLRPVKDEHGNVVVIVPEGRPIEDFVFARNQLLATLESTGVGTWQWSIKDNTITIDERFAEIAGYTLDEFLPFNYSKWNELIHPDDKTITDHQLDNCLSGLSDTYVAEYRIHHKSGKWVWVRDRGKVYGSDVQQAPEIMYGTLENIDERKQAEMRTLLSEKRFRSSFYDAPAGMALVSEDGRWLNANDSLCNALGYTFNELRNLSVKEITHPEYWDKDVKMALQLRNGTLDKYQIEKRYIRKDGSQIHAILGVSAVRDENGEFIHYVCHVIDITARKVVEKQLEKVNQLLNEAQRIGRMGAWELDLKTDHIFWSHEVFRIHELESNTPVTKNDAIRFYHPDDQPRIQQALKRTIKTKEPYDLRCRFITAKNNHKWVRTTGVPQVENGVVVRLTGIFQDITQQELDKRQIKKVEQFSNELIENMRDGFVVVSAELMQIRVNQSFCRMTGFTQEELIGKKPPFPYLPAIGNDSLKQKFEEMLAVGTGSFELTFTRKNGTQFQALVTASSLNNENGNVANYFATVSDISELKKAQVKSEELTAFQDLVLNTIPGYLFVKDSQYRFVNGNKWVQRFFERMGTPLKIGQTMMEGFSEEEKQLFWESDRIALETGSHEGEEQVVYPDGETQFLQVRRVRFKDLSGNNFILALAFDITKEKKAKKELRLLLETSSGQNAQLQHFAQIVSHNLRSHAAGISGLLALIKMDHPNLLNDEIFELLGKATGNLVKTIDELKDLVQSNMQIKDKIRPLNLFDSIEQVKDSILALANQKQVKIANQVPKDIQVMGIPSYLESILLNLLTNGIKYSQKRDETESFVKITAKLYESEGTAEIIIEDNGKGIDMDQYGDSVFGLYQTFHGNDDSRGIGLFITKNQIEAVGGSVSVESKVNVGTAFKVVFHAQKEVCENA